MIQRLSNFMDFEALRAIAGGVHLNLDTVEAAEASAVALQTALRELSSTGIPAEELAHYFDRFRRTRRSNEQGTGLGLAICSEVARRHGIAIDVASRVGEGTTFRFTFPDGGS